MLLLGYIVGSIDLIEPIGSDFCTRHIDRWTVGR